jgi:hypothetical protein
MTLRSRQGAGGDVRPKFSRKRRSSQLAGGLVTHGRPVDLSAENPARVRMRPPKTAT